jgi:hypothetical protein
MGVKPSICLLERKQNLRSKNRLFGAEVEGRPIRVVL